MSIKVQASDNAIIPSNTVMSEQLHTEIHIILLYIIFPLYY